MEVKRLLELNTALSKELEIEKEKLHSLEAALEGVRNQGLLTATSATATTVAVGGGSVDVLSVSRRLTMLEMKELNERQRADHAVRMYDQQKLQLRTLEDRNFELESKFAEVRMRRCFLLRLLILFTFLRTKLIFCVHGSKNRISLWALLPYYVG